MEGVETPLRSHFSSFLSAPWRSHFRLLLVQSHVLLSDRSRTLKMSCQSFENEISHPLWDLKFEHDSYCFSGERLLGKLQ